VLPPPITPAVCTEVLQYVGCSLLGQWRKQGAPKHYHHFNHMMALLCLGCTGLPLSGLYMPGFKPMASLSWRSSEQCLAHSGLQKLRPSERICYGLLHAEKVKSQSINVVWLLWPAGTCPSLAFDRPMINHTTLYKPPRQPAFNAYAEHTTTPPCSSPLYCYCFCPGTAPPALPASLYHLLLSLHHHSVPPSPTPPSCPLQALNFLPPRST
jgi:hypothetical protein